MAPLYGKKRSWRGLGTCEKSGASTTVTDNVSTPSTPLNTRSSSIFLWHHLQAPTTLHLRAFLWPQGGAGWKCWELMPQELYQRRVGAGEETRSLFTPQQHGSSPSPRAPRRAEFPVGSVGIRSTTQCIRCPLLRNK